MTLYFRRFKIHNPFYRNSPPLLLQHLAKEAAKKEAAVAARKAKGTVWERAMRWLRSLRDQEEPKSATAAQDEQSEEPAESVEKWEGDYTVVLDQYE